MITIATNLSAGRIVWPSATNIPAYAAIEFAECRTRKQEEFTETVESGFWEVGNVLGQLAHTSQHNHQETGVSIGLLLSSSAVKIVHFGITRKAVS